MKARLERAWEMSDRILGLVRRTSLLERPIRLRHPFLFYLGHLPAFAWNQVASGLLDAPAFRPEFDDLFQRGIDPEDAASADGAQASLWPAIPAVEDYRDEVRVRLVDLLDEAAGRPGGEDVLHTVLEHELMHHETLLYMIQALDLEHIDARTSATPMGQGRLSEPVRIPAGEVTLGARRGGPPFGWDNEFPEMTVSVDEFVMDSTPVMVGQYLEFVETGAEAPRLWSRRDGDWTYRTPFDEVPLTRVFDWPAAVSQSQAAAYARWRGARLPTEPEVVRAAYGTPDGVARAHPWGDDEPRDGRGNFGFRNWSPTPAGSHPEGRSAFGIDELVGNGWEWTSTPFGPFPGFEAMSHYPFYSADFFGDGHVVALGASWATDDTLVRRSFRNWFRPGYPYVFAKFRCVRPA